MGVRILKSSFPTRHPEVRAQRASKGDGRIALCCGALAVHPSRLAIRWLAPQDDGLKGDGLHHSPEGTVAATRANARGERDGVTPDTEHGASENSHDELLSTMPQVAIRGPFGDIRQAVWPCSKLRPCARQVQSAAALVTSASSAATSTTAAKGPSLCMAEV